MDFFIPKGVLIIKKTERYYLEIAGLLKKNFKRFMKNQ